MAAGGQSPSLQTQMERSILRGRSTNQIQAQKRNYLTGNCRILPKIYLNRCKNINVRSMCYSLKLGDCIIITWGGAGKGVVP